MKLNGIARISTGIVAGAMMLLSTASAAPKIVYVAPDGTGDGTGGWENATSSVADAYDSAAAFAESGYDSGEVWVKTGRYLITGAITMRPHVVVRGGFSGGETTASAADRDKNLTILSGDTKDDDYWKPNGSDPTGDKVFIWAGDDKMMFNSPNPEGLDDCWKIGVKTANVAKGFVSAGNALSGSAFFGLTFTGFATCAIEAANGGGSCRLQLQFLCRWNIWRRCCAQLYGYRRPDRRLQVRGMPHGSQAGTRERTEYKRHCRLRIHGVYRGGGPDQECEWHEFVAF